MAIPYQRPPAWASYDRAEVADALVEARSAVLALRSVPYQRAWVDALQQLEFKREIAGTSRIEGAEFTERELDDAVIGTASKEALRTKSQKQARCAVEAYRWIATVPADKPITTGLILDIHRRLVEGCDDDHCPPGRTRGADENVTFGIPRHRGVEGGTACKEAFEALCAALTGQLRGLNPLLVGPVTHYHLAAMHPFLDGNGRTARAVEALCLQRAGLRDTCFIAMSNYYHDQKATYLDALAAVRRQGHDLTPFLVFALAGIASQAGRLLDEIHLQVQKALFRNLTADLFGRLRSPKKRVIAMRQREVLQLLLDEGQLPFEQVVKRTRHHYGKLLNPERALVRDLQWLRSLRAIEVLPDAAPSGVAVRVRLSWPTEITETEFFATLEALPKAKTGSAPGSLLGLPAGSPDTAGADPAPAPGHEDGSNL